MESKMSNSDMMMVDPGEIVIDMPVDEQNVLQKMESMKERGIIQPVTLWLQGMRVIDGFHRSVAAQRLGWKEIPCYVVDCSEDAFWDARIQSARQHHRIESERLSAWITESWKVSEWYRPESIAPELVEQYHRSPEFLSLCEMLWRSFRKGGPLQPIGFAGGKVVLSTRKTKDENSPLVSWIGQKAKKWGIETDVVVDSILEFMGINYRFPGSQVGDAIAGEMDLSFEERLRAEKGFRAIAYSALANEKNIIHSWVKEQVIPANEISNIHSYVDFRAIEKSKQDHDSSAQSRIDAERQAQFQQTPQGQAEAHNRKVQTVKEAADRAVWALQSIEHLITDSKEFSEPIAEAIASLTAFHNEQFRRRDTQLKDRLATNNAKLRKEVKVLTEEVASLKRALNAKQLATPRLPHVMVEHSQ